MTFAHLHLHSHYSLLDALLKPDEIVEAARASGMDAVALTDHGNVFGAIEFHEAARRAGIKPIFGMEAYLTPGSRHEKAKRSDGAERGYHLLLLAADDAGYRNLIRLASIGYTEGFYYNARIDREALAAHAEGLIGTSACLAGEVAQHLLAGRDEDAERAAASYREIFGAGNFFLEVQDHGIPEQRRILPRLREISDRLGIPRVATNDVHYLRPADARAHDVLLCVGVGETVEVENRKRYFGDQFHLKTPEEMRTLFADDPGAVEAAGAIAARCAPPSLAFGALHLPPFPLPADVRDEADLLERLARESLGRRFGGSPPPAYEARLATEIDVIRRLGFASYFLVVADFIRAARGKGIAVGPGRGSAAGSLVAYLLGITEIDPIPYGLLFERFLNPERREMPDIDVDFERSRRDEVIEYVRERYGADRVAQIVTFGTLGAKAVVRDVARALGIAYGEADRLAKAIPFGATLAEALEAVPELAMEAESDRYRELFAVSRRLEGLARHASKHAAGVVIADRPLAEIVPLYVDSEGTTTTQWDMNALARLGLLKIDLLGLVTLDVIEAARRHVEAAGGRVDWARVPLDDAETYALLRRGRTLGVFQLDSTGIRDFVRRLGPTTFEDLAAILALYRPGPMNLLDQFVARKHRREPVRYLHPALEPILKDTYGIITYQEQVMRIAHEVAGLPLAEADHLRKAMGKKIPELMAKYRDRFVDGAVERGIPRPRAVEIFDLLERFAAYGFNRSHAVAYAMLSFRTAYLKAHHPNAFMAALLSSEISNRDKLSLYISEARAMGIRILPPDVRESDALFKPTPEGIRFGLLGVKGVGENAVAAIARARDERPFRDLFDVCARVDPAAVNRKTLEALVQVGAFDWTGIPRRATVLGLDAVVGAAAAAARDRAAGQMSLFGDDEAVRAPPLPTEEEYPPEERLALEKNLAGLYISGHPLDRHAAAIRAAATATTRDLAAVEGRGRRVRLAGLILAVERRTDRRGAPWARVRLEDLEGECEVLVFASDYQGVRALLAPGRVVLVEGRAEGGGEGGGRLLADRVSPLGEGGESALVLVLSPDASVTILKAVKARIERAPRGETPVVLRLRGARGTTAMRLPPSLRVAADEDLVADLRRVQGVLDVAWGAPGAAAAPPPGEDVPF